MGSASIKFDRHPDSTFSSVFNDILGFRSICSNYEEVLFLETEDKIRVVDMSKGKTYDDGYRGVYVYYQKDNFHYPIGIQYSSIPTMIDNLMTGCMINFIKEDILIK